MLQARVECIRDTARIHYKGDTVDITEGPLAEITDLIDRGVTKILINLEDVDYINSSGISTFLATLKLVNDKKVKIALYNLHPNVDKVIRLTRMENLLPCFDKEDDAARFVGTIDSDSSITKRDIIIVVEKTIDISRSLNNVFEEFKQLLMYSIIKVDDLDRAYSEINDTEDIGLVIIDINYDPPAVMEFLEKIRTDKSKNRISIIIATPDENISHAHFLIRNGADDMLRYPFNKYEASSRIRFALYLQREIEEQTKEKEKMAIAFR